MKKNILKSMALLLTSCTIFAFPTGVLAGEDAPNGTSVDSEPVTFTIQTDSDWWTINKVRFKAYKGTTTSYMWDGGDDYTASMYGNFWITLHDTSDGEDTSNDIETELTGRGLTINHLKGNTSYEVSVIPESNQATLNAKSLSLQGGSFNGWITPATWFVKANSSSGITDISF